MAARNVCDDCPVYVQKFRFCGDGDCPDWVLAEINSTLSVLSAVKLKILTQTVCKSLLGDAIPVWFVHNAFSLYIANAFASTGGQNTKNLCLSCGRRALGHRRPDEIGLRVFALSAGERDALRCRCGHIQRGTAAARPAQGAFGGDLSGARRVPAGDYGAVDHEESDRYYARFCVVVINVHLNRLYPLSNSQPTGRILVQPARRRVGRHRLCHTARAHRQRNARRSDPGDGAQRQHQPGGHCDAAGRIAHDRSHYGRNGTG